MRSHKGRTAARGVSGSFSKRFRGARRSQAEENISLEGPMHYSGPDANITARRRCGAARRKGKCSQETNKRKYNA